MGLQLLILVKIRGIENTIRNLICRQKLVAVLLRFFFLLSLEHTYLYNVDMSDMYEDFTSYSFCRVHFVCIQGLLEYAL